MFAGAQHKPIVHNTSGLISFTENTVSYSNQVLIKCLQNSSDVPRQENSLLAATSKLASHLVLEADGSGLQALVDL